MKLNKLTLALALALGAASMAQAEPPVKIGFITDLSGVYSAVDGPGGVAAIKMAIQDFGGSVLGRKIELTSFDHQNKADLAAGKAKEYLSQDGVDMLIGGTNSATALAMEPIAAQYKKPFFVVGAGASTIVGKQCTPYTVMYAYNTTALARGTASAVIRHGGKNWYFLTADYAFGKSLESEAAKVVEADGGKVVGQVYAPLGASDFSSYLLQAQASKAQVLGLANAGGDADNSIKQANQFGVTKTMKLAGLLLFITDIHAVGLPAAQGLYLTTPWYWNQNAQSRAWAERYFKEMKAMPTFIQAGDYSATLTYLKAVKAAGTTDGTKVMDEMHKMKVNDMFMHDGFMRPSGLMIHDMYLEQVKTPAESKEPWDYYKLVQTIPGNDAFGPAAAYGCPLDK
ncbi:MAG: ABC transporter substrate-binding protein [Betaproteobacteria bacterium]|jgi:branched-chain amino acid transport system substrate-binding protein|nr:ABC transporter substrate-binding protein [Betaproteobacteria bacterium]MDE2124462.1 ABC transporter substrate-binding protein [Betaproteobacteria bacterium]MDE2185768.1 ABC transporter substrate-binding protein [Betaproteobacteria bacterium]MDE2324821.1 ABC transporter substrate-binding protein [Betaproteobacteria bacterium]NNM63894.1 ABC transporter substrate-binding protein [Burkholderiales bacterium]